MRVINVGFQRITRTIENHGSRGSRDFLQAKYGCKGKKLYFAFVDLEKAFDRVPREVTRWALRTSRSGGMVGECSHGNG